MKQRRRRSGLVRFGGGPDRGRRQDRKAARPRDLIGRDLAQVELVGARRRRWLPLLVGGLLAALCLTVLRVDLIRQRYDLAAAMGEEKRLLEERRLLTARVRGLRDPARLAELAAAAGFARPDGVILFDVTDVALGPRP